MKQRVVLGNSSQHGLPARWGGHHRWHHRCGHLMASVPGMPCGTLNSPHSSNGWWVMFPAEFLISSSTCVLFPHGNAAAA